MANEGIFLVLGGIVLLSMFRRPGNGAAENGGQIGSLYGGGSLGDFAAAATLKAEEASGVGEGYGSIGDFAADATLRAEEASGVGASLTVVPMLVVGPGGGYVKVPEKAPPPKSLQDEDIGSDGFLDLASFLPAIDIDPSSLPVIEQKARQEPVPAVMDYGHGTNVIEVTVSQPVTFETPLRLAQVVNPDTGIISEAGFGPKGDQGFVAQNIGVLQAAMAGYGSVNEYRAAVEAGEL